MVKPDKPTPEECCGSGCVPCIYDYYYDALEKWQAQQADLLEKKLVEKNPEGKSLAKTADLL